MLPRLGGIDLYLPILSLSVILNVVILVWLVRREGYRVATVRFMGFIGGVFLFGFLGAKLLSIFFHSGLRDVGTELSGGLRYPGALIGVLVGGVLFRRFLPEGLNFPHFADLWAPAFAMACAIGRVGCLLTGCCYGRVCYIPWAVHYPRGSAAWYTQFKADLISHTSQSSLPVHPFPLYLFIMEIGVFALLMHCLPRRRYDGQVILIFLATHGALKSIIEFTREPYDPFHQIVMPISILAIGTLWWNQRRVAAGIPGRLSTSARSLRERLE